MNNESDSELVSVPDLVEFERELREEGKSASADDHLDRLQSLNTALCFLCSVNADALEVEQFLVVHPDALLLEGAGNLPEESAHFVVEEQIRRCECFNQNCNQNRIKVLSLINRGFEYYQRRNMEERPQEQTSFLRHAEDLKALEREIRELRVEELTLRNRLLEMAIEVRSYKDELNQVAKYDQTKSALSLLACTRNSDVFARRSVLEYQLGVASLNLSSIEREHNEVLHTIRHCRRIQFGKLMSAFDGCHRHVCLTSTARPPKHSNKQPTM